jgi:predicted RNA-binding protein with PUA-like domain
VRTAYPDPTADDPRWVAVELAPLAPLTRPVGLAELKSDPALAQLELLRRSRHSVVPVTPAHWAHILELGQTRL